MAEKLVTNVSFMALNYGDDIARGEHTSQLLECPPTFDGMSGYATGMSFVSMEYH